MAKLTGKDYLMAVVTAIAVLLSIALLPKLPLLSTVYGLSFMAMALGGITLGQAIFGGAGALIVSLLIAKSR